MSSSEIYSKQVEHEPSSQAYPSQSNDITLRELVGALLYGKWIIISVTAIFAIISVIVVLQLSNIFRSEALLAPVSSDSQNGLSALTGQFGGLAALAGVNLGGGSDKTGLTLEIIKSRDFISKFIIKYDLFVSIMAAKGWNQTTNELIINEKIYDEKQQLWVRETKAPFLPKPSLLETYDEFRELLNVYQDKTTGMVKISIEHYSPFIAKQWVDSLIKEINEEMRLRELDEAQNSIDYLNQQIQNTTITGVKTMLYSLIEEQTKTVMLASVRKEYVLQTIDPAVVAEKKAGPARALICLFALLLGMGISSLFVLVRYFSRKDS